MTVSIEVFRLSDQKKIRQLILNVLKQYGFRYDPKYHFDLDDIHRYYVKNGGAFYVLKINKKIKGTIGIIKKGRVAELRRFYVDQDYQGKGYGSKLIEKAVQFCIDQKFTKIEVATDKNFTKAHMIYRKKGFKVIKKDAKRYYLEKVIDKYSLLAKANIGCNTLIISDNKILLGLRKKGKGAGTYGLPGGHVEYGEKLIDAAIRETKEECNINAVDIQFSSLIDHVLATENYIQVNFVVNKYKGKIQSLEPKKCEKWEWFELRNLPTNMYPAHVPIIEAYKSKLSYVK